MSFGILTVVVLGGLGGPLVSASERVLVPVIVGELLAGLIVGRTGFGWVHADDPTTAFLASIGFAMLMFTAGMHIPVREPELVKRLGRGAAAAGVAAVLAVGAGVATARIAGVSHPAIYVVILASGSAAVLVPSLHEAGLLNQSEGLVVAAQIAIADVAAIVAVPLVLQPNRATHALLGALAVSACAVLLFFTIRGLRGASWVNHLRLLSKQRGWALDLRVSLLVLFGLAWLATRAGTSVLVAGFAVGLVVAAVGGPKRLSRQVTGVAQGFFVPLFFVVLGAQIDLRAFGTHASLIGLAALLTGFNIALSVGAALVTRQSVAAGLASAVALGVPAAIVALGLQQHVITPGIGAAIMVAALASIGVSGVGVALLHRRLRPPAAEPALAAERPAARVHRASSSGV
ncbi:MAG TPA: cation:proton antiporter [Gaiellaceae bacterium]|nr:cation:proton antiporter [Gaiellaceae bacterium]